MKRQMSLILLLCCLSCSGCAIFYPSFRSVGRFDGRLVYSRAVALADGQHKKGDPVPNVPLVVNFDVTKEDENFLSGTSKSVWRTHHYYTFTNDQGQFSIPRITEFFLGQFYWLVMSTEIYLERHQTLIFLYPYAKDIEIINTNRKNPYLLNNERYKIKRKRLSEEFGGWGALDEHIQRNYDKRDYDPILEALAELEDNGIPLNDGDDQKLSRYITQKR